jgi:hypothetical protein
MDEKIFDLLIQLEDDLVLLYKKLSNISRFSNIKDVLEYMMKQSSGHSMHIGKIPASAKKPSFNTSAVLELHNKLKDQVFIDTVNESNTNKCLDGLSRAEEIIGELYQGIAKFYQKTGDYYYSIGSMIENLSQEEFAHRDALQKQKR